MDSTAGNCSEIFCVGAALFETSLHRTVEESDVPFM